jgi:uncharacterized membrane protein
MNLLAAGLIFFLLVHLVPSAPALRARVIDHLGTGTYKGLFVLLSALALALVVAGKRNAGFIELWSPPTWSAHIPRAFMPLSFYLIAAAYLPGNIKRYTRHPMLWGIVLWALSHLAANGDLASIALFTGFGAYALFAMWSQNRRGATTQNTRKPLYWDALAAALGITAYIAFGLAHGRLIGVPAFSH